MIGEIHVDLGALRRNARTLASLVRPAEVALVVKSNAYGHGLIESARAIAPLCSRLCVFDVDEALALRESGVGAAILILGPIAPASLPDALRARCEIALWDTGGYLDDLVRAARAAGTRARAHVKINTGVNRFGLEPPDAPAAIDAYLQRPELEVAGLFSHLAAAEELDSPLTAQQLERFGGVRAKAQPLFDGARVRPLAHVAASAAAMLWPHTRLDFVRCGIALYGLWPSTQTRDAMAGSGVALEPALSFRSSLVATRGVAVGSPIGYGAAYHAPRDMTIGVVPLGYADGIPRALSNTGAFVVQGVRCPIVGRVCMNATMLDVSQVADARAGTPVTLIGTDGTASVTADDWAFWAGTINYEIVARLPERIPRRYDDAKAP